MTLVGISASRRNQRTSADYILAGRQIGPIATALSAVSTCHSGFMFIGMIGFTYVAGISAIWLIIAWLIGDFVAWRYIYPKLRQESAASESITIAGFISHSFKSNTLRSVLSAIVLVFLSVYAAAQLTAGSKAPLDYAGMAQHPQYFSRSGYCDYLFIFRRDSSLYLDGCGSKYHYVWLYDWSLHRGPSQDWWAVITLEYTGRYRPKPYLTHSTGSAIRISLVSTSMDCLWNWRDWATPYRESAHGH